MTAFDLISQYPDESIFKNIDGIKFLTHQGGCGGTRQDSETLCKLVAGYIHNPNVAGARAIMIGIGLGIFATSIRYILGIEKSYIGE